MEKPIVVVGSINTDLVVRVQRIPVAGETISGADLEIHPGGKGANQAAAVARLGYPVHMIGRVGSDAYGALLRGELHSAGVDITSIAVAEGSSGVAIIAVTQRGENSISRDAGRQRTCQPWRFGCESRIAAQRQRSPDSARDSTGHGTALGADLRSGKCAIGGRSGARLPSARRTFFARQPGLHPTKLRLSRSPTAMISRRRTRNWGKLQRAS